LSRRCDSSALRARATTRGAAVSTHHHRMCALPAAAAHRSGQRSEVPSHGDRSQAAHVRSALGGPKRGTKHHRRILTEMHILLVRRACQGTPPPEGRSNRHVSQPVAVRLHHPHHTERALRVSASEVKCPPTTRSPVSWPPCESPGAALEWCRSGACLGCR
jgi:hypothetical protein